MYKGELFLDPNAKKATKEFSFSFKEFLLNIVFLTCSLWLTFLEHQKAYFFSPKELFKILVPFLYFSLFAYFLHYFYFSYQKFQPRFFLVVGGAFPLFIVCSKIVFLSELITPQNFIKEFVGDGSNDHIPLLMLNGLSCAILLIFRKRDNFELWNLPLVVSIGLYAAIGIDLLVLILLQNILNEVIVLTFLVLTFFLPFFGIFIAFIALIIGIKNQKGCSNVLGLIYGVIPFFHGLYFFFTDKL